MSDINALFHKDPFELTDKDLDKIIDHFRTARAAFNTAQVGAKTSARKLTAKEAAVKKAGLNLGIEL